jgi:uncharacterized protein YbcI
MTTLDQLPQREPPTHEAGGEETNGHGAIGRSPMLEIANAMVRLYKGAFGRGPTKARAVLSSPDLIVVTLENSLTVEERNLARLGHHDRVRSSRLVLQRSLEHEFRSTIEGILGRRTRAFISGIDVHRDVAVELFTLDPEPDPTEASEP